MEQHLNTAVVSALTDAIRSSRAQGLPSDWRIVNYSDAAQVDGLWADLGQATPAVPSNLIILFDGLPKDWVTSHPFRPEFWLTPWDWAMAASTMLVGCPSLIPTPGFSCWIIDLLPADGGRGGRQRFKSAAAFTPWIRSYRPFVGRRTAMDSISQLWVDLDEAEPPVLTAASVADSNAAWLSSSWIAMFAAPGDRHAIGNLVGPLLLAEGVHARFAQDVPLNSDRPTEHFRTLLRTVGLATAQATPSLGRRFTLPLISDRAVFPDRITDVFQTSRTVRFLLVDDQARLGYHHLLSHLILGPCDVETPTAGVLESRLAGLPSDDSNPEGTVRSLTDPAELLADLRDSISATGWDLPRVLGEGNYDVLFIDLRLFADSTTSHPSAREEAFLGTLIDLANRKLVPQSEALTLAVAAARRRKQGGREELAALTLFPLLLSLADPSLPIVVFSSSHQLEVLHAFAERPNVITSFNKPIVTGYATAHAGSVAVDGLLRALDQAARLHRIRPVWKAITRLAAAMKGQARYVRETLVRKRIGEKVSAPLGDFPLSADVVPILRSEFENLIVRRRFADALMTPTNILEAAFPKGLAATDLLIGDVDFPEAIASLQFYRVLQDLRNARAHYQCEPLRHDEELEVPACWAWLLFVDGCCELIRGEHPIVPGATTDVQALELARADGLLPFILGDKWPDSKRRGLRRCEQIIGMFGELVRRDLTAIPSGDLKAVATYARGITP